MNINTFYNIFYRHRFQKANLLHKIYLSLVLPFKYILNYFYLPPKIDLDELEKKKGDLKYKDLNYLFDYFNSDKGNLSENQYVQPFKRTKQKIKVHGYGNIYEKYFKKIKNRKLNIMEIGSFYGNASASLFFYFRNSFLYAGDICPDLFRYNSKRIKNFYINSSDEKSIYDSIIKENIKLDIIIEDASHSFKDQIISLFMLFKNLNSEGIFIVEELDFPDTRQDMNLKNEKPSLREILNKILKKDFSFNSNYISAEDKKYFLENFSNIEVFKGNFNEIAIITKK